jgi:hypothetical protein
MKTNVELVNCNITKEILNYNMNKRFMINCFDNNISSFNSTYINNLNCHQIKECDLKSPCNTKIIKKL